MHTNPIGVHDFTEQECVAACSGTSPSRCIFPV